MARRYVVREEDRLSAIAALHGVEPRTIVAANPHKARLRLASGVQVFRSLEAGEDLVIPTEEPDACGGVTCPAGTHCVPKRVVCVMAPCPQYVCEPDDPGKVIACPPPAEKPQSVIPLVVAGAAVAVTVATALYLASRNPSP